MTRDQLKAEIASLIDEQVPENRELSEADVLDVQAELDNVQEIIDSADEEADEEERAGDTPDSPERSNT
jgi:hypothetical protein